MSHRSQGRKKSNFPALTGIPANATLDFVTPGVNFKITLADFLAALNVTGTIVQDGAVAGTPVLDKAGTVNNIRNIEDGPGILSAVSPENGLALRHNFIINADGVPVMINKDEAQPTFRSVSAGSGIAVTLGGDDQEEIVISVSGTPATTKTVIVNTLSDLPSPVGSVITLADDTEYFFNNDVSVGANDIVLGNNCVIAAADSSVIMLSGTGSGTFITSTDVTSRIGRITLEYPNGAMFDVTDSTGTKIFQLIDMTISSADTLGDVGGHAAYQFNNVAFFSIATGGFDFTGSTNILFALACLVEMTDGSFFDFGAATIDSMNMDGCVFTLTAASSHAITATGSTNIGSIATMTNCRTSGSGTLLDGVATTDDKWQFDLNDDIRDTRTDALISLSANATETAIAVINTPVLVAGTWDDSEVASQFTIDTAGRATYTGVKDIRLPITISATASMASGGTNSITLYIAINGVIVAESGAQNDISTISGRTTAIWQHTFSTSDFVELWVENNDGTVNIIVTDSVLRVN